MSYCKYISHKTSICTYDYHEWIEVNANFLTHICHYFTPPCFFFIYFLIIFLPMTLLPRMNVMLDFICMGSFELGAVIPLRHLDSPLFSLDLLVPWSACCSSSLFFWRMDVQDIHFGNNHIIWVTVSFLSKWSFLVCPKSMCHKSQY